MRFAYDDDQQEFARAVRTFLERRLPVGELPERVERDEGRIDPATWREMADSLGLQGVAVPERYGGSGYGAVEVGLVLEETGRALVPGALLASMGWATSAFVLADDDEAAARYLPPLAAGETVAALAIVDPRTATPTTVRRSADGAWRLDGAKAAVVSGDDADVLVVVASDGVERGLFVVERGAPGLTVEPVATVDPTRPHATVTLRDVPAHRLAGGLEGEALVDAVLDHAGAALAAEQVGGVQACLDLAVAHATAREQFGRPIGGFQAIKHRCADILVRLEAARTASWFASWACAHRPEERAAAVAVAQATASEAYAFAARQCIQILGGVGFTWEHPAHLYFKRSVATEQLLGAPDAHLDRLAARTVAPRVPDPVG